MVKVEFRKRRLRQVPTKPVVPISNGTMRVLLEPEGWVDKYIGQREVPEERLLMGNSRSFAAFQSMDKTTITNLSWKEACKQGGVDVQKINKATKEKVTIAQWKLCHWHRLIEEMSYDFRPNSRKSKDLAPLQNTLEEIFGDIGRAVAALHSWEKRDERSYRIIVPALKKLDDAQHLLCAALKTHEDHVKITGSQASRRTVIFERWTWCVAAAFQEAGGKITMTLNDSRYIGGFYLFALRLIRDESEQINGLNASAFGAELYRALANLRKPRKSKNGQEFVILEKSRLLRVPT